MLQRGQQHGRISQGAPLGTAGDGRPLLAKRSGGCACRACALSSGLLCAALHSHSACVCVRARVRMRTPGVAECVRWQTHPWRLGLGHAGTQCPHSVSFKSLYSLPIVTRSDSLGWLLLLSGTRRTPPAATMALGRALSYQSTPLRLRSGMAPSSPPIKATGRLLS